MDVIPPGVTRQPPKLPQSWLGRERETGWKLDATTGTFIGRPLTPNDAGRRTYNDFGPETLLRLGAPATVPAGRGKRWSPIVTKWGLQVLNAGGFINGRIPPEHVNRTFNPKGKIDIVHADDPIHPVLRKDMWVGITDHQWNLIKPALHLATAILDTPDCLKFFWAYFGGHRWQFSPHLQRRVKIVDVPAHLDVMDMERLYHKFVEMRKCVSLQINPSTVFYDAFSMACTEETSGPGLTAGTSGSIIRVNDQWIRALEIYQDPNAEQAMNNYQHYHGMDPNRRIHISAQTTKLHVLTQFAQVIIHELAHATVWAGIHIAPGDTDKGEPFFPNNRTAEAGYAVEKFIFGGHIGGHITVNDSMQLYFHAPYGLKFVKDFDWDQPGRAPSPRDVLLFPVPAVWGASLFERRHWQLVERFGAGFLKCPEFNEWAVWRGNN